jgi:hypothetical protein
LCDAGRHPATAILTITISSYQAFLHCGFIGGVLVCEAL